MNGVWTRAEAAVHELLHVVRRVPPRKLPFCVVATHQLKGFENGLNQRPRGRKGSRSVFVMAPEL